MQKLKRSAISLLAATFISFGALEAGWSAPVHAGETDICASTFGKPEDAWSTGSTRYTKEAEDIWWGYTGDRCYYAQEQGIHARTVVNNVAQAGRTWGARQYDRYRFTLQTGRGVSYKLQWKLAPTTTEGKWHFEN